MYHKFVEDQLLIIKDKIYSKEQNFDVQFIKFVLRHLPKRFPKDCTQTQLSLIEHLKK